MWKVLLVEDEPFVRRSIRELIDWESSGFTIIGEAGDGEEAVELIKKESPDLVLSDIIMPVLDGIELLRQSRSDGFDGRFIMLTCMNDFEYARQALELGADGYMLKLSMTVQSLGETLSKTARQLERQRDEKLRLAQPALEKSFQEAWERYIDPQTSRRSAGEYTVAVREAMSAGDLRYAVVGSVLHGGEQQAAVEELTTACIRNYGKPQTLHEFIRSGIASVFLWYKDAVNPEADMIVSRPSAVSGAVPLELFPDAWFRVLRTLDQAWYVGGTKTTLRIGEQRQQEQEQGAPPAWPWKLELELVQTFERREPESCAAVIARLGDALLRAKPPLGTVLQAVARLDGILAQLTELSSSPSWSPPSTATFRELWTLLRERIERRHAEWIKASAKRTDHAQINLIVDYIHRYYDRDVTLKSMARMVAMDEHYLSGLFKKKTGETLIHYIQRIRIEQAKHYLVRTDMPVLEIGEKVGFVNANYFFKIFKRWTGLTPSDYRKQFH